MSHLVTGGAGFVGVNLIPRLLARGHRVLAADNLSRGRSTYLSRFQQHEALEFVQVDCADHGAFAAAVERFHRQAPITDVWHLAANSDIPGGVADPRIDLKDTFLTTFNALLVMRSLGIPTMHFASSSAIYGDFGEVEIHEDIGPLAPISNYGAMKLAAEAQIRAALEAHLARADIFRFPNVVGVPATHGVILDFVRKLKATPERLPVLGDGTQRKAYLHVEELVDAMLFIVDRANERHNVFNIGPSDDGVQVKWIAEAVREQVMPAARIEFGSGNRGWVGDIPKFRYSTDRLAKLGWQPHLGSPASVKKAIEQIVEQEIGT